MTDLQIAINNLTGHTICLCKGERCIFSEKRGIAPIMDLIAEGTSLAGYSVADTVVGKAAALLFVKCKIKCVYAETLSEKGERILRLYGLDFEYGTLAKCIINRAGTDICPMEKAVEDTDDPEEAYLLLKNQTAALKTRGTA